MTTEQGRDLNRVPEHIWVCEDCGWQWPLKDAPYQSAECDACGGEMHQLRDDET